ncbi:hypothetical protein Poli38472_003940 [Pythium oligandrum]|uniref:Protein kinase domain-containing protein n=1 Tax=Pythium oligandrum TaxID=41045 RepID=A0A8K1CMR7_PYTOL|nr:hypothetical protein Poli38472_003940 [Pythium oligandrum]|eukprot:TMW66175.1 hypothetical protein Poli38472_003940 [Pythium oligandrum]
MLYRPSLLFVVDGVCVFRGEETESYMNIEVARKELCANTLWSYGQVPCVFGYGYEKRYPHGHDLSHIESVYRALEIARVPNVVRLVELDLYDNAAIFEPHDKNGSPANLTELFIALRNVLEALVVLHREGWAHGDIRWSKVLKRRDRESWFLIDLDEATISPQRHPSGTYLTKDHHAAEVSQELGNIHTAAADIWSVGQLIESCDPTVGWASCKRRMAFLKRLLANDPPTAQ